MINVRGMANAAIQPVNENITALYLQSNGYAKDAYYKQVPGYLAPVEVQAQVQAVSASALQLLQNVNMEGVFRNVRMWGNAQGVVRPDAKGGDLLKFPQVPGGAVQTWKVEKVLETWPAWCSVIVSLQTDGMA